MEYLFCNANMIFFVFYPLYSDPRCYLLSLFRTIILTVSYKRKQEYLLSSFGANVIFCSDINIFIQLQCKDSYHEFS